MSEFKVDDRVTWETDTGTIEQGIVKAFSTPFVLVSAECFGDTPVLIHYSYLTHIEEPQPWQGECRIAGCRTLLTPGEAHIYHFADDRKKRPGCPVHCVWYCAEHWQEHLDSAAFNRAYDDSLALRRSRAWMAGRYPDEAKWKETT